MHHGPVTQWGVDISWPLVCQTLPCSVQSPPDGKLKNISSIKELIAHRKAYFDLANTYNPNAFNATHIAKVAKEAGFQYVIYTTVHCDGFANWASNVTKYNIMNSGMNPARDIFGELVIALRNEGLKVGAYVCPTLWNNPNFVYPDPLSSLNSRGGEEPTYDPLVEPQRWSKYLTTMHSMVVELANLYKPDMFWFDCHDTVPSMDTRLEELVNPIRTANPDALILTRNGIFSDYAEMSDQSESLAKKWNSWTNC